MTPQLRFPEFTDEWQVKKLDDIAKTINGLTYTPKDICKDGVLVLRSSNIKDNRLAFNDNVYVSESIKYNKTQIGDILICVRNGSQSLIGKNVYINSDLPNTTHGAFMTVLRSDDNLFIFQLFQTKRYKKQVQADLGARINSINNSQLLKYTFSFPEKSEQQKIADFMGGIDTKLASIQAKVAAMHEYKKGVMQALFSGKLRFKDENGNPYPDWEEKKLGELLNKNKTRNKDLHTSYVQSVSNKYGFVSQDDYFDGANIASKNTSNYFVIEKGTFAYNPSRIDVGSLAYKSDDTTSIVSPLYVSFRPKDTLLDGFLLSWFSSRAFISQMHRSFEGSVRNTLSFEALTGMNIDLPSNREQQKIADFLSALDDKIKLEEAKLAIAKEFKKALLQRMFV